MKATIRLLHAALLLSACGAGVGGSAASSNAADVGATPGSAPVTPAAATKPRMEVPQSSPASKADVAKTASHATMVAEMRRLLVGKATIDGTAITDVRQVDACHTSFTTTAGDAVIDWAEGGNIAPRQQDGREINDLPGSERAHPLSMPVGGDADGVSGAVGLLVAECTP